MMGLFKPSAILLLVTAMVSGCTSAARELKAPCPALPYLEEGNQCGELKPVNSDPFDAILVQE